MPATTKTERSYCNSSSNYDGNCNYGSRSNLDGNNNSSNNNSDDNVEKNNSNKNNDTDMGIPDRAERVLKE